MLSFSLFFVKNFNFSLQFLAKRGKIVYNDKSVVLGKYFGLDRKENGEIHFLLRTFQKEVR